MASHGSKRLDFTAASRTNSGGTSIRQDRFMVHAPDVAASEELERPILVRAPRQPRGAVSRRESGTHDRLHYVQPPAPERQLGQHGSLGPHALAPGQLGF